MAGVAKYKSTANTVSPIEPNGTRPISTLRPDRRSHNSEPMPTPAENITNSTVTTSSLPPRTSLV
jgi:hypothetical protein